MAVEAADDSVSVFLVFSSDNTFTASSVEATEGPVVLAVSVVQRLSLLRPKLYLRPQQNEKYDIIQPMSVSAQQYE